MRFSLARSASTTPSALRMHQCWRPIRGLVLQNGRRDLRSASIPFPKWRPVGRDRLTSEHANDAEQDLFYALDGAPPLACALVRVGIVAGRVQDRDAHFAVRVDWHVGFSACSAIPFSEGSKRVEDSPLGWKRGGSNRICCDSSQGVRQTLASGRGN